MNLYCNVTRGENVESVHEVYATVINEDEEIIFKTGKEDLLTCVRSSLKPFQASATILEGAVESAGFSEPEIALMCASHNGELIHVETAKSMMKKIGLEEDCYECGHHPPYDLEAREISRRTGFTPFHNNCSGKHAGMLALSKHLKSNIKNYIKYNHPVQIKIFDQIKRLTKKNVLPYGIDGCSAPTPFLSIKEIALLFNVFGANKYPELEIAYNAMVKNPYLTAGKQRFDTDFNNIMKGRALTKVGGEAIRGMVIKTSKYGILGIAQKVLDGNQRANESAIMYILNHLGVLSENESKKLKNYEVTKLFNHQKKHIGDIRAILLS
tara:strand:+ start:463 stop:1437 length:975 start_codon:yes stop_codon:yes gene_type:complete